jgi:NADH dehydrogenase
MTNHKNILILGGSGFIGTELISQLVKKYGNNVQIIVPTRQRQHARHLWVIPQVKLIECSIFNPQAMQSIVQDNNIDTIIHSIGILHGQKEDYQRMHVQSVQTILDVIKNCSKIHQPKLIHISGIGANTNLKLAPSQYLQSKGQAEELIHESGVDYLIFQPSVVFGANDSFLRLFATLLKHLPIFPLAASTAKLQPVFVGDVCQAIINSMENLSNKTIVLVGPETYSLQEIVEFVQQKTGSSSKIIPVPLFVGKIQASVLGLLPLKKMLSHDNLLSLQAPFTEHIPDTNLGVIHWHAMDSVCTDYLKPEHACDILRERV